jgi:hypothetical protein
MLNFRYVTLACIFLLVVFLNNNFASPSNNDDDFRYLTSIGSSLYSANVISVNNKSPRFIHTVQVLRRLNIVPRHIIPPRQDSEDVQNELKVWNGTLPGPTSLKLAHFRVWDSLANNNDYLDSDFQLIFEDDVEISTSLSQPAVADVIDTAARLAERGAGFFYLGLCDPRCEIASSHIYNSIVYTNCFGLCSHAYGLFKWRSKTLQRELSSFRPPGHLGDDIDQWLFAGLPISPLLPILAASNLSDRRAFSGHFGIFFQDRKSFPTELFTDEHWLPH